MRIRGGKKELIEKIYQGYDIAFDVEGGYIEYTEHLQGYYASAQSIGCLYLWKNVYNWNTKIDVVRALNRILEEIEILEAEKI